MFAFQKKEELQNEISRARKRSKLCSTLRAVLAIASAVFLICFLTLDQPVLYGLLFAGFMILFLAAVTLSQPVYRRAAHLENKNKVYQKHEQRREKNFSHFADQGTEFKNKEDYKLSDLDIFGPKSLFQYVSEAKTPLGRQALAKQLSDPKEMPAEFTEFVASLAEDEKSLDLESILMEFKKGSTSATTDEFVSSVSEPVPFKLWQFLPILSFLGLLVTIILCFTLKINKYIPLVLLMTNLILSKVCVSIPLYQKDASGYYYLSDLYCELADSVAKTEIEHSYYKGLQKNILEDYPTLKRIRRVYGIARIRKNLLLNLTLNILFSFDAFAAILIRILIGGGLQVNKSLESIAELEVALSFKNIGMDNDSYCIPSDGNKITAKGMKHIFVKGCVANSITLKGGIVLTGSNMSGKTTFMRVLGLCVLLKNAGSIVPAEEFHAPVLGLYTSLRANDMLQEGVSTFYAEIKRMKAINTAIQEKECLILVDEIFKGTNALERISASRKVIEKLNRYHAYFIISTHDFELCDTEGILNYHFEEGYEGDRITFDYTLKEGSGTKGNAMFLLKMSGIIEE